MPINLIKDIAGQRVLYAMAAKAEYGDHLKARFKPLMTGVGPIESAIVLTRTLASLKTNGLLPHLVVCLGSSGSQTLEHTKVYQAKSISWRDMDASAIGFEKGVTPFLDLPAEIKMPWQIPGVPSARLSTGANIVSGKAYDLIDADMVDMEAFAALRACQSFDVPMIALRGISDGKSELGHINDWTEYLHIVDKNLAEAVDRLEDGLRNGEINLRLA